MVTANQIDIDAGKIAKSRSKNKEIQAFADLMIADHTADGAKNNTANLQKLSGAAFDKAYIDHEVTYHQAVLDASDKVLIPSAQNAELKALIVEVRPAFAAHLDHAKMVQGKLGN